MEKVVDTPAGRFTIRPYQESDEKGTLALWHAAFGKEMSPEVWRWKYRENPYGQQMMLCVSDEGQPVAMYSGIPYRAKVKEEEVRFSHLVDNMSHPDFRGAIGGRRGIFVKTADEFFSRYGGPHGSVFFYGLPGRRNFVLSKRILQGKAFPDGASFLRGFTSFLSHNIKLFAGKIERIDPPYEKIDRPFEANVDHYPCAVIRDRNFLAWRFGRHPERSYEVWTYRSNFGRRIKAYTVLLFKEGKVYIVDLIASPSRRDLGDFFARLSRVMAARGIETVETWLPSGHFLQRGLVSIGFEALEEPLGFVPGGRVCDPSLSFDWIAENIYYNMADADLF